MARISVKGQQFYRMHGWNDKDIAYLQTHAQDIEEEDTWVMGIYTDHEGIIWLYPTTPTNIFPVSLWKRIKWYIQNNDNVIIPMNENMDLVLSAAKRYNGFLVDNVYLFGDELKGLQNFKGGTLWSTMTS